MPIRQGIVHPDRQNRVHSRKASLATPFLDLQQPPQEKNDALRQQMDVFRFLVASQIDASIETLKSGKVFNFSEHATAEPTDEFKIAMKRESRRSLML